MNDSAFRHAKGEVNRLPCVFARALREQHAVCEFSVRADIAGPPQCAQPLARISCGEFDGLLREKSVFALGRLPRNGKIPMSEQRRLHVGGLTGLRDLIDAAAPAPNVHRLLRDAISRYGELSQLPFAKIIQRIASSPPSRRKTRA
jgi:hypothetical protein